MSSAWRSTRHPVADDGDPDGTRTATASPLPDSGGAVRRATTRSPRFQPNRTAHGAFDSRREPMSVQRTPQRVRAEVELRVPRGAMGDLEQGVHDVLSKVDAVGRVERAEVRDVRPTSFDIHVTVAAALEVRAERAAVRETLLDGFGIERLEHVEYG